MISSAARTGLLLLAVVLLLAGSTLPGHAVDAVVLRFAQVTGPGWSVRDVHVQLDWLEDATASLVAQVRQLQLPAPVGDLLDVRLECPQLQFDGITIDCPAGRLLAQSGRYGRQRVAVTFRYRVTDHELNVHLDGVHFLGGNLRVDVDQAAAGWQVQMRGTGLGLAAISRAVHDLGYAVPVLSGDSRAGIHVTVRGNGPQLTAARLAVQLQDATFSNAAGSVAGDHAGLDVHVAASPHGPGWQVHLLADARTGALYFEPLYLEASGQPIHLDTTFDWLPRTRILQLRELTYRHPGVLAMQVSGSLDWRETPRPRDLQLELQEGRMPGLYKIYLQPWLLQGVAGTLQTTGSVHGRLTLAGGQPVSAELELSGVGVEQQDGLFGFRDIDGTLRWSGRETRRSTLGWQSGHLYRIDLGPTRLALDSVGRQMRLVRPAQIPVLDGGLEIDAFDLAQSAGRPLHWAVDGILTPVSLQALTGALDWPEFGGKLSGVIPQVSYDNGVLRVGGVLQVRVFGGEVTLRDLTLEQPFGEVPRLQVSAQARQIDLEQLTRAFSFGRIEGKLAGRVDGLQMENWQPVAFDAEFATPPGDRSRHRISQKAVDNISSIGGGGVGGALSRSLLRLLEDFPYDRLGIRCRLQNGICAMGGVAPVDGGYYLVKSRFIPPRLDVIGYADRVNWSGLVAQLKRVVEGQAAGGH
jgi:hypothetical protein